jgi:uncharacterized LabA/DUF88 family protein
VDRCVVFVDAGYLLHAASTLMTNGKSRNDVILHQVEMLDFIRSRAEEQSGLPLLRICWYDASKNRIPDNDQRALATRPDVKLRLGSLKVHEDGGKERQKGVDAALHGDMVELARNKGAADFIVWTGDEDLLRAVEDSQAYGVRVHLWGVQGLSGGNQSAELVAAVDRVYTFDAEDLRAFISVKPDRQGAVDAINQIAASQQVSSVPQEDMVEDVVSEGDGFVEEALSTGTAPNPKDLAVRIGPRNSIESLDNPALAYSTETGKPSYSSYSRGEFARLSEITMRSESEHDQEEDRNAPESETAFDFGRTYGLRWMSRSTDEALEKMRLKARGIPREIDGDLLGYAIARGADTWGDLEAKQQVRDGFWDAVLEEQ